MSKLDQFNIYRKLYQVIFGMSGGSTPKLTKAHLFQQYISKPSISSNGTEFETSLVYPHKTVIWETSATVTLN